MASASKALRGEGRRFRIIFDQEDLKEFATGKISNVFGNEYAAIDTYSRRVMLPMDPYLLVSRVTKLNAKLGEFKPSFMQTEYDIPYNAWFTTDRQIPWAVSSRLRVFYHESITSQPDDGMPSCRPLKPNSHVQLHPHLPAVLKDHCSTLSSLISSCE